MPAGKKTCMVKNSKGRTNMQKNSPSTNYKHPDTGNTFSPSPFSKIKPNIYMPKQLPYWVRLLHLL
jgi:hypothetical protein